MHKVYTGCWREQPGVAERSDADDRLQRAPENILGVPLLGDTSALLNHRIVPYLDRVVIAITSTAEARVGELVDKLGVLPNPLNLFIDVGGPAEDDAALARIAAGGENELSGATAARRHAWIKRAQDLVVAIAGLLANKKYIPESSGTLKADSLTFGIMIFVVIIIVTALSYFPPLALGPIAEYFSLKA